MECLLFIALMFGIKFVITKMKYATSITYLCHKFLITIFNRYYIILADISETEIFLLLYISSSPQNPIEVAPYSR